MASRDSSKPNIVFILADDQAPWALCCAGNREIRTPNLDRLARSGTRFERFFCTSPVCSPARASLLTGAIPSQHGVHDWIREGNVGEGAIEYLAGQRAYTGILSENGYNCGISGKWHLGDSARPQKSLTHWYVHQGGSSSYHDAPMVRDGKLINQPGYITDAITDEALSYLQERSHDYVPFYLSVHYTAPHSPWIGEHPQELVDSYDDCSFQSCPQEPEHPWSQRNSVPETVWTHRRESIKGYFAAVTAMDLQIGRILDRLEQLGLQEHTLVAFTSDNGYNCGHHGIWGKGNGTFPQNMYDSSVLVPTIFSQPGRIPGGAVSDALVSGYDWMPTLLEYLGLENPDAEMLPGTSFLRALTGKDTGEREHVVVYDEYGPVRMVRTREWKYVHRYPYGPHELYDLIDDPGERENLVDDPARKNVVVGMKSRLEEWFVRYTEPMVDGTREPVTGKGQLGLAGPAGRGVQVFSQEGRRD